MVNDGDTINVSVSRLRETASSFQKASQDTFSLLNDLTGTARQLINEMSAELHHSPSALERLCDRWYEATNSLGNVLLDVAHNLNTGADNYQDADTKGMPSSGPR